MTTAEQIAVSDGGPLPERVVPQRPHHLVVVGAAAGIGRWLGDHVLSTVQWDSVRLVDVSEQVLSVPCNYSVNPVRVIHRLENEGVAEPTDSLALSNLRGSDLVVVVAVPLATLTEVLGWLVPLLPPETTLVDLSHDRSLAGAALQAALESRGPSAGGAITSVGVHALFGTSAESADGQIFALCSDDASETPNVAWLVALLESVGGTVNQVSAQQHDTIMSYVQGAAHQTLLTFARVLGQSGLDLERDLWANRTPVFELLLALSSRVLAPGQDSTTSSIQVAAKESSIIDAFVRAQTELQAALDSSDLGADASFTDYLESVRSPFSGALFTKIQQAGVLATSAVQSTRSRVASQWRSEELVGVRSLVQGDRLHVGRVRKVTSTSFVLEDLLVGNPGKAALLTDEAAIANARRLGIAGKPRSVEFSLGRVRLLNSSELEAELDDWLAVTARGCKFLIPESISGASALRVVESVPFVEHADLVSEEVRLGQRECVVRFSARVDRKLNEVERAIQRRIDEVYVWPDGVVLPLANGPLTTVGFLGPAGTFSDVAARQLARLLGAPEATRVEYPDFATLVAAVETGEVQVSVVPITNSSSGLVDLSAGVLSQTVSDVRAGGVVDVPVRFDAYVAPGTELQPGDEVYSHPQGFRQCSVFVNANKLIEVPCTSTAEACARVRETGRGVALAAAGLEAEFGLRPARASVGNLSGALTRFLVLGQDGCFGTPPHADATSRSLWILDDRDLPPAPDRAAGFDEILRGPSGSALVVSSRPDRLGPESARFLGTIPWSPRTPLVAV